MCLFVLVCSLYGLAGVILVFKVLVWLLELLVEFGDVLHVSMPVLGFMVVLCVLMSVL